MFQKVVQAMWEKISAVNYIEDDEYASFLGNHHLSMSLRYTWGQFLYLLNILKIGNPDDYDFNSIPAKRDEIITCVRERAENLPELLDTIPRIYSDLNGNVSRLKQSLIKQMKTNPREVITQLLNYQNANMAIDSFRNASIDELLGIVENIKYTAGHEENWGYEGTPYNVIMDVIDALDLQSGDTFYDLGCGYGRVLMLAGLLTDAVCKGIEYVPEIVDSANSVAENLGLDNVEFYQSDILASDYSDGDVFFMFNPFSVETFGKVVERLREIASEKPITIVSFYCDHVFENEPWLQREEYSGFSIYRSIN